MPVVECSLTNLMPHPVDGVMLIDAAVSTDSDRTKICFKATTRTDGYWYRFLEMQTSDSHTSICIEATTQADGLSVPRKAKFSQISDLLCSNSVE